MLCHTATVPLAEDGKTISKFLTFKCIYELQDFKIEMFYNILINLPYQLK